MGNNIKFGIFTPPRGLEWIYRTAELAESGNYDSVWMPDHLVGWGKKLDAIDAWTTLAALAVKTKRVHLGIGVTDPHRKHPAVFAHQAMTLDQISGGRTMIGIGAGEAMNLAPYGIEYDRAVTKLEEFLRVVKNLWTKKMVSHQGNFYKMKNAFILPRPSFIPLYVAGNAPKTMKITAMLGDGWLPFKRSPEVYRKDWDEIRKIARENGRNPDEIVPGYLLYTAISKDREHARKIVEEQGKMLLIVSPRRIKELGYTPPTMKLDAHKLTAEGVGEFAKVKDVPLEAVEKSFVFGTPDDCVAGVEKFIDAGCRYFMVGILNPGAERDEAIKMFSEEVIARVR